MTRINIPNSVVASYKQKVLFDRERYTRDDENIRMIIVNSVRILNNDSEIERLANGEIRGLRLRVNFHNPYNGRDMGTCYLVLKKTRGKGRRTSVVGLHGCPISS